MSGLKYSPCDFFFTCLGLLMFLLDLALDVWAAVSFYQDEAYVCLGILLLLLLGSSILAQVYSLLWYSYNNFKMETRAECCLSKSQLILLHVFQLGLYIRQAGVLEMSIKSLHRRSREDTAMHLSHDLSILRIIETFSENAPQFVLMFTIILREGHLDLVTVLKAITSLLAIAFSLTTYQLSRRSCLPDKEKRPLTSLVVFFLWNLLLLSSRLTALAFFASVLPCFIFTHFFCSWLVLFFFAWRSKTNFMESACGEWLHRATVALIWYFDWFHLVKGGTRTLLYYIYVLTDICLLCGVWCWKMNTDPPHFAIPPLNAIITAVTVVAVYVLGLFFRLIYYKLYHKNVCKEELKGDEATLTDPNTSKEELKGDEAALTDPNTSIVELQVVSYKPVVDKIEFRSAMSSSSEEDVFLPAVHDPVAVPEPPKPSVRCSKRMRKLAENFYT